MKMRLHVARWHKGREYSSNSFIAGVNSPPPPPNKQVNINRHAIIRIDTL